MNVESVERLNIERWTSKELELLNSDLSVKQIAEKTGRSVSAIYSKRYAIKHELNITKYDNSDIILRAKNRPAVIMSPKEKIERINDLAYKMHITLCGRNEK